MEHPRSLEPLIRPNGPTGDAKGNLRTGGARHIGSAVVKTDLTRSGRLVDHVHPPRLQVGRPAMLAAVRLGFGT